MSAPVLFVVPNVPYPLVTGGHLRDWQILNLLARAGIRPTLLYFGAGEGRTLPGDDPVSRLCAEVRYGGTRVEDPDRSAWRRLGRKLSYLGSRPATHPFAYQYDAMGAGEVILREARRIGARTVVLRSFWCHHAPALRAAGIRVVANCPDSNLRLAREMVRCMRSPLRKVGPLLNLVGVSRHERAHLGACDEVWAPTAGELAEIATLAHPPRLLALPNLLDVAGYPDASAEPDEGALLFVGNFAYAPNANAARLLLGRIFPAVRARVPGARLHLVGAGLPPALGARAARTGGVLAPGFAPDLLPWYRRAALVLLPVREGAGMLFKAVEALACGKAAVGVPAAFRGIHDVDARAGTSPPFVVASSWQALADETVRLLGDVEARRALGRRARAFAEARLSWDYGMRCLERSILLAG